MSKLTMSVATQTLRLAEPFRIAGHVFDTSDIIVVTLRRGSAVGRGEASGVFFLNEGVAQMQQTLEDARSAIEAGEGREALCAILPPGGARNAVDCALWELEAQEADKPVWALAGLDQPKPLRTTFTLGADSPDAMAHKARAYDHARSIKIKLTGDLDLDIDRVRAIRDARPDAWLGIDGNQGFRKDQLPRLIPALVETGVSLIEQPLARDRDQDLEGLDSPIPVAGDESLLCLDDIAGAVGRFQVVNIKLDKCGGLTDALAIREWCQQNQKLIMVGNMLGSSLAMAPALVVAQGADFVDLDGPMWQQCDVERSLEIDQGCIQPPHSHLWG